MNNERLGVMGAIVSGVLLFVTTHPVWLLSLIVCSAFYGWNLGKRLIPADEYGA